MIDIKDKAQLEQYLLAQSIISAGEEYTLTYCTGGVSSIVVFLSCKTGEFIVKQALAQL